MLADRLVVAVKSLLGAVGVEPRGRVICGVFGRSTGSVFSGRSWVDKLKPSGKSFDISKWEVWEAYRQVKANRGAPGVDGVTLEEFDKDLKNNLYKIWNRMSSGSYFPPPVKAMEIPKPHGGETRTLGVPRSRTGWPKRWWPAGWRRRSNRSFIQTPTAADRTGRL